MIVFSLNKPRLSLINPRSNWFKANASSLLPPFGPSNNASNLPKVSRENLVWTPPPLTFCKLKFDGSKISDGNSSFGFVIRDELGQCCFLVLSLRSLIHPFSS